MKTVGVINRIDDRKIIEIAEPFGVVAAVIPSTNPTSTAIYKILIAIKARCAVVMTPHPSAARCITRTADIMNEAGRARRAARRRHRLDEDRHARRHAGTDEGARGLGDSRHRRHGPGARRLQRRQAGLRRRSGQRAVLHRVERRRPQGRQRHSHRQVVRQRRALLVAELGGRGRGDRGRSEAPVQGPGRLLPVAGGSRDAGEAAGDAAAAAQSGVRRQVGGVHRPEGAASPCRRARAR